MKLGILERTFALNRAALNKEKRTCVVQFSSEAPVKRWFGEEILDHSSGAVNMSRMEAGAAVLMEHDVSQRCGITEAATITATRTGEATIRFSRTPLGDSAMGEVEDGTLRWVSVGYRVNKFQVNEDEDEYRAVSWEPLEVSFVAIPADPTARVLRGQTANEEHEVTIMKMKRSILLDAQLTPVAGGGGGVAAPPAPAIIPQLDVSRELDEVREISALVIHWQRTHPEVVELGEKSVRDKVPLAKFQRLLLDIASKPGRADISAPAIGDGQAPAHRNAMSIGQRFTASEAYRSAIKNGSSAAKQRISVEIPDEYQFRDLSAMSTRTTFSSATESISGTGGAAIQVLPGIPGILNQQPLYVSDLFAQGATGGDIVRYIEEQTFTNAATRVAEGSAKPEGTLDVGLVNATVQKTAVFLKITDEMLSDFQQMQSYVNARLGYMVQALEDQQLLTGSGSSQIKGVLNFSGIQTLNGATNPIDTLAKAIEYVRGANSVGFAQPDAIIMHPLDWLNVKLTKDANGQYLFGGPGYAPYGVGGYSNVATCWGLPLVSTTSITRGTALTGAFRMAAQIFRRQGLTLATTNSDNDDFQKNLITIRAEQRMALAVYQPNRFCSVTAIPA